MKKTVLKIGLAMMATALVMTPQFSQAETRRAAVDACSRNDTGNCLSTKENLQYYLDVHRRGGIGNDSFLFKTFWNNTVWPGFQKILTNITIHTVTEGTKQGTFMEGQDHIRAASALQQGAAETARNYLPSEALCRFGSLSQSLASDDMKMRSAQIAIANIALKREVGARGSAAQAGAADDQTVRMNTFIREYCNEQQGNQNLMCGANTQRDFADEPKESRYNRDINYTRTIDIDQTLDADFIDTAALKPQEQDIISLGKNLYGHKQLSGRLTEDQADTTAGDTVTGMTRSVAASRMVAQNSYAAITAMKSRGSGGGRLYMRNLLARLDIPEDKIDLALSDKPSYYAQMDILTKKLYQEPSFYVSLMEGKTNVARQSGAMEGLELMQDRDIYNSMRRSEMLLALLIQLQSHTELNNVIEER